MIACAIVAVAGARGGLDVDSPNIYDLLMVIRGLSNEITVQALASQLGISYSTLARCKSGTWPRSITLDAMRGVLDDCRSRFFDGDGEALADSVTLQLRGRDVDTTALENARRRGGYEAFVSELLAQAAGARGAGETNATHEDANDAPAPAPAPTIGAPRLASARDEHARNLLLAIPIAIVLLAGLLNLSLSSLFAWAAQRRATFCALSLLVALSPVFAGVLVDAPLAWRAYRREHADATLTLAAFARVSKYGDVEGVAPGAGRFDLSWHHLVYQALCNVSGMLCYVSLFAFLLTLPNFASFLEGHEWIEFFKVGIVVASLIAYGHARDQLKRPDAGDGGDDEADNPDNYLPTRVHVWANNVHLVWTLSLCIVLLLIMIAYGVARFRMVDAPVLMLWPYLQAMAFLAYSDMSPHAVRARSTSVGAFLPGVVATSAGVSLAIVTCYRLTWGTIAICATCALCVAGALAWTRYYAAGARRDWLSQGRGASVYSMAMAASIAFLLVVGMATSAFL